jgi:hypothetical protein
MNESEDKLCKHHKNLDFKSLCSDLLALSSGLPTKVLPWRDIQAATSCPFCRLITSILRKHPHANKTSTKFCSIDNELFTTCEGGQIVRLWLYLSETRPKDGYLDNPADWRQDERWDYGIQVLGGKSALNDGREYGKGRRVPAVVGPGVKLMRIWMKGCGELHGRDCQPAVFPKSAGFRLRVIDVDENCVVEIGDPSDVRYVALSYVWGGVLQLRLTVGNKPKLYKPGGLLNCQPGLSKSIADAIVLVKEMGARYLWVDSLCIVQDDEEDKRDQIQWMGMIYGCAYFTIVSAVGRDANGGLPGLRPGTRSSVEHVETIDGVQFTATRRPYLSSLPDSVWESRGWTFQEKILSKRLLIFTEEQVFFHCGQAIWFEDAYLETTAPSAKLWHGEWTKHLSKPKGERTVFFDYRLLVKNYATRQLTYESDTLDAFSGIAQSLRRRLGQNFYWGLPESMFDAALLWTTKNHFPHSRREELPSWSWAGWRGPRADVTVDPESVQLDFEDHEGDRTRNEISFYLFKDYKTLTAIGSHGDSGPYTRSSTKTYQQLQSQWKPPSPSPIPALTSLPPPTTQISHLLRFWTSIAVLTLDSGEFYDNISPTLETQALPRLIPTCIRCAIYSSPGTHMGSIILDREWRLSRSRSFEFIVVSRMVPPRDGKTEMNPILNTLLVEWKDGIAERVQKPYGGFREDEWIEAGPEWRLVTMA